jgi:hypothetical protein
MQCSNMCMLAKQLDTQAELYFTMLHLYLQWWPAVKT